MDSSGRSGFLSVLCLTFRSSRVPCGFGLVSLVTVEVRGALRVLALLEISGSEFIPPWMVPRREQTFAVGPGLISASQGTAYQDCKEFMHEEVLHLTFKIKGHPVAAHPSTEQISIFSPSDLPQVAE